MSQQHVTDKLATSILVREGVAAIWALHVAAAEAHRTGYPHAAAAILEIAEAAENKWLSARQHLRARLADVIGSLDPVAPSHFPTIEVRLVSPAPAGLIPCLGPSSDQVGPPF